MKDNYRDLVLVGICQELNEKFLAPLTGLDNIPNATFPVAPPTETVAELLCLFKHTAKQNKYAGYVIVEDSKTFSVKEKKENEEGQIASLFYFVMRKDECLLRQQKVMESKRYSLKTALVIATKVLEYMGFNNDHCSHRVMIPIKRSQKLFLVVTKHLGPLMGVGTISLDLTEFPDGAGGFGCIIL